MTENAVPSEPTTPREPFDFRSYPKPEEFVEWWNGIGKRALWEIDTGDLHNLIDVACDEIVRLRSLQPDPRNFVSVSVERDDGVVDTYRVRRGTLEIDTRSSE